MKIQYNTISNWVNLAKGEHNCHFCGKTFPWKAALDKHIEKQHQVSYLCQIKNATTMMVQDGEGDGEMSRKGTSVIHYDPQFREEVVAFAKNTSRKEAKERCKDLLPAIA